MSDWRKEAEPVPDWRAEAEPVEAPSGVAGSPLEKALASQKGDVVTVETPTGPAQFDRQGRRVMSPEESQQMGAAGGARLKERALEGALSVLSGAGPVASMAGYFAGVEPGDDSGFSAYRKARALAQRDVDRSTRNASPVVGGVPVLPMIGAAIPSMLAPNPATALQRIGASAAVGAEQAADASPADLTRGEIGPLLTDAGKGMARGAGTAGLIEGLTLPMRFISRGAGARIGDAASGQASKDVTAVADEIAEARGQLGGESTKAGLMRRNMLGAIEEVPADLPPGSVGSVSDAARADALAMLKDPDAVRLAEKTLARNRSEYPAQVSKILGLESDLASKVANASQEAGNRTRDYFGKSTWKTEVKPRLATLGENALLGAGAGAVTGGATGLVSSMAGATPTQSMLSGIISGVGASALSGGSGLKTLAKNAMASPRMQASALQQLVEATQASQGALRKGANISTAANEQARERPKNLDPDEEDAVQAFLKSP